jgi:hypothetical protein
MKTIPGEQNIHIVLANQFHAVIIHVIEAKKFNIRNKNANFIN